AGAIAHKVIGWPIVRVRYDFTWSLRHACPGRPKEKGIEFIHAILIFNGAGGYGISLTKLVQLRIISEKSPVILGRRSDGIRAFARDSDGTRLGIVGVRTQISFQANTNDGLLLIVQRVIQQAEFTFRQTIRNKKGFSM